MRQSDTFTAEAEIPAKMATTPMGRNLQCPHAIPLRSTDPFLPDDGCLSVTLGSLDAAGLHRTLRSLAGRRVRITVTALSEPPSDGEVDEADWERIVCEGEAAGADASPMRGARNPYAKGSPEAALWQQSHDAAVFRDNH